MATVGQIREFTRDTDWAVFKARLEQYFIANDIGEDVGTVKKRRAILLNSCDEDCYKLLSDLCVPNNPPDKSYTQLVVLLDNHFGSVTSVFGERKRFYSAVKHQCETVSQWAARVKNLSSKCKFGTELNTILRDKFIMGFDKGTILDRLLEEDETLSLENAISIACKKEAGQANHDHFDNSGVKEELPAGIFRFEHSHMRGFKSNHMV